MIQCRSKTTPQPTADSGIFREALLKWYEGSTYDSPLRQAGRMIEQLTRDQRPPETELSREGRLRAIMVDLIFLVGYLQEEVDVRTHSSLEPPDDELASEAAAVAAALRNQVETLIPALGLEHVALITPAEWEDFVGLRETALSALDEASAKPDLSADGLRTIAELVYRFGLEAQYRHCDDESPTARDLRAAITDLRRLAEFTRRTADHLPTNLAGPLAALSRELFTSAAQLTHALSEHSPR